MKTDLSEKNHPFICSKNSCLQCRYMRISLDIVQKVLGLPTSHSLNTACCCVKVDLGDAAFSKTTSR